MARILKVKIVFVVVVVVKKKETKLILSPPDNFIYQNFKGKKLIMESYSGGIVIVSGN